MKVLFVDIETTGTDKRKHGIIQVAGIIDIDGKIEEEFDITAAPYHSDEITSEALKITKRTEEEICGFQEPRVAQCKCKAIFEKYIDKYDRTDKLFFSGFNSIFDDKFLREWWRKAGDKYYGSLFFWPTLDAAVLAAKKLMEQRADMARFNQLAVAEKLGIKVDEGEAHDALYDVRLARKIFYAVTEGGGKDV